MCIDAVIQDSIAFKALKALVLTVVFFVAASSSAQIIYGNTGSNNEHKYLFLEEVIGGNAYVIDSMRINNGQYQFNKPESPKGYYRLSYAEQNRIDFINDQNPIEINFNSTILQNDLEVIQSKENKILWQYKYYSKAKQKELKSIMVMQSNEVKGKPEWNALQSVRDSILLEKSTYLATLCSENPETLFTRLVGATQKEKYLDKEEEKNRFFEHIDFSDPIMVRSSILPSLMMNYFQLHTEYSEEGFIESIDRILSLSRANTTNYEFCLNFILTLFNRVGPDIVFQYVVEKYLLDGGCSDSNISEHISELAENYRAVQPGNLAPMFMAQTTKGDTLVLKEYIKNSEYTVLYFWSSHCGFCAQSKPDLELWQAKNQNVKVLAISVDQSEVELTVYLKENEVKWDLICDYKGWKSDIILNYKIHKTPSFYVINERGIIMARPANIADLTELSFW
jgi:peroxiredoxin